MAQPLTATAKLEFLYVVNSFNHRLHTYMAYNDVLGQHQMVDRDGITTVLWTLGAQYLWDKFRAIYTAAGLPAAAQVSLFARSGTIWNLVDVAALTGIGTSAGAIAQANQSTWVVRDTAFKKIRFISLENVYGYAFHVQNGISGTAPLDDITKMINGTDTSANAPFRWMKSRGDRFIAATGAIAGLTMDLNDKLKRARGLA